MQTLVDNVAAFEKQYGYDGVDIDWEYPETDADRRLLVELMARLRKSNPDYVLSIDAPPWHGYGYDLQQLMHSLDYFNIMMYDCAGPWTAMASSIRPSSGTSTILRPGSASRAGASDWRPTSS